MVLPVAAAAAVAAASATTTAAAAAAAAAAALGDQNVPNLLFTVFVAAPALPRSDHQQKTRESLHRDTARDVSQLSIKQMTSRPRTNTVAGRWQRCVVISLKQQQLPFVTILARGKSA